MLTKFSFGRNVSSATFRDAVGEETKKLKTKLIYFSCIAIIVGSFDFEFKGISGVIEFSSNPPIYLIGGILGLGIGYYLTLFLFYLGDDYLKWNNEIIIENTKCHWDLLGTIDSQSKLVASMLSTINDRIDDLSKKIYFSSEFLEGEDEYLSKKLGNAYSTLKNYIRGAKGVSLREFRDTTRPFCQRLGDEAARYLLEKKIRVDVPDDVTIYAVWYYLSHVITEDIQNKSAQFASVANDAVEKFSKSIQRFQNNNLGLSFNQWIILAVVEFLTPVSLACIGAVLVHRNVVETLNGILAKLLKIST